LVTGEINRADGLDDVVVAVAGADGPAVLVFEGPEGALRGKPKVISVTAEVSALALGQLDDYYPMDLAVAAGNELLVVHGQDLLLGLNDEKGETRATPSRVDRIQLAFAARSLVIGDFKGDRKSQIALLAADGGVHVASRAQPPGKRNKGRKRQGEWKNELWASGQWAGAEQMVWARLSSVPVDNMVIIDQSNRQLHVVTQQPQHESQPSVRAQVVALEVDGDPVAVLPMRLNEDALHDLVVLRTGASAPAVVPTAPVSTIAVNSTADTNVRDNELTLREAILLANGTLAKSSLTPSEQAQVTGTPAAAQEDAIRFSLITVGTPPSIKLLSPLDWITDTVTIDGTTVFAGRVELDGTGAGVSDGLNVVAGRSVVRGLVINGFKADIADGNVIGGVGIRLFENGANIIEGNFLGTNGLGTSARGNAAGVVSNGSSNNIIGGNTASARNLISGNTFLGVALDSNYKTGSELRNSTSNQVQNNLVGTDMAGTAGLGNGTGAVGGVPDNHFGGVLVLSGSSNNTIARNVISGNGTKGVEISGSGAAGNQVQNNFIGTNVNGTGAIGNAPNGVLLNASNNRIVGNVISGNRGSGVYVLGTSNQLQANLIGVAADGTTPVGNSGNGVRMGLVSFTENIPANSTTIVSNTIAFNGGSGILLVQGGGNAFLRNSVHSNSGLGIQFESIFALSADHPAIGPASHGPTANDTCDADGGPNNLQNYPVLTSATFYRDQHDHRRLAQQHIEYHVQNRVLLQYDVRSFGEWRGPDVSRCCSRGHQQRLQCDH
jgi:CSLREA domain-containing protein